LVGGDVLNGVGGGLCGVELDWVHRRAIDVGGDAEVEVCLRAGVRGAEVSVAVADMDGRRVVDVDLDDGRCAGGRGGGRLWRRYLNAPAVFIYPSRAWGAFAT
jgi:hypothetical protein